MNESKQVNDLMKIKLAIKLDFIKYFDDLKFEIDIKAQEMLCDQSLDENSKEEILKINLNLLERVDEIFNNNLNLINNFFEDCQQLINQDKHILDKDKEEIKMMVLNSYCYFINADLLKKKWNQLGLLIISDWYLDENQLNYLRYVTFIL
jgi:hypothetical protein